MAAHASKRAKEDDRPKKEKVQEEKEASKQLKEEMEKKTEINKIVEMLQNARISRMFFLKGSAPKENGKPHHKSSGNGGSSSDNDDSDLSSTSSEEEKSEMDRKQKTAYEMTESDWSSDVCSSDLVESFTYLLNTVGCYGYW